MRKLLLASLLALTFLFAAIIMVTANTTPERCDVDRKYWCSKVSYDPLSPTSWIIRDRWYKGGVDGLIAWWELYYYADWEWDGSRYVLVRQFGPVGPFFNVTLSSWKTVSNDSGITYRSRVTGQNRYHEDTNNDGIYDFAWCSNRWVHRLHSGDSYQDPGNQCYV